MSYTVRSHWIRFSFALSSLALSLSSPNVNLFLGDRLQNGSPMLSERCPVCPVCIIRELWPNGWTDEDET